MKSENSIVDFIKRYWSILTVGVFGCVGFYCLIHYISIVTFHELSKHPNGFPASIVGGLVAFCICMTTGILWISHIFKEEKKGKYFLVSLLLLVVSFVVAFFGIGIFGGLLRL